MDIGQKNTLIIGVLTLRRQMEGYCILEKVRGEGWRFLGLQNRVHFILGLDLLAHFQELYASPWYKGLNNANKVKLIYQ